MPTTTRCHECDHRFLAPDEAAGKTIRCPRCKAALKVPLTPKLPDPPAPDPQPAPAAPRLSVDSEPVQPHWEAAPPPVRRPTPAPAPEPTADPDEPQAPDYSAPHEPSAEGEYAPPEPWYYGFLEKYTLIAMWVGIVLCTLPFAGFTVGELVYGAALLGFAASSDDYSRHERNVGAGDEPAVASAAKGSMAAAAGCLGFIVWLGGALVWGLAVLSIVFSASLILLAVDAARNVRAVRFKTHGP